MSIGKGERRGLINLSLHVNLVPNQHPNSIGCKVLCVLNPLSEEVQRRGLSHAVHKHRSMRIAVVVSSECPEPLNPGRVPDAELQREQEEDVLTNSGCP